MTLTQQVVDAYFWVSEGNSGLCLGNHFVNLGVVGVKTAYNVAFSCKQVIGDLVWFLRHERNAFKLIG